MHAHEDGWLVHGANMRQSREDQVHSIVLYTVKHPLGRTELNRPKYLELNNTRN